MPNIDEAAKRWELDLAGRVGKAVLARRKVLGMTAVQLAERTKTLGYPVSRVTVTKIENNTRAGKLDVAEWLALATALEVPPALLLFPDYPDGTAEPLPGLDAVGRDCVKWLTGPPPDQAAGGLRNDGVCLLDAVRERDETDQRLFDLRRMEQAHNAPPEATESVRRMIAALEPRLPAIDAEINKSRADLWGESN
jgi:transcriptional regulator with XRE-family HTH domain